MGDRVIVSCVWCGGPMEKGFLFSSAMSWFQPEDGDLPAWAHETSVVKHHGIPLKPRRMSVNFNGRAGYYEHFEIAYACRNCRKIVIPYSYGEK